MSDLNVLLNKACSSKGHPQNLNTRKIIDILESQVISNDSFYQSFYNGYHFFVGDDGYQVCIDNEDRFILSSLWISKDDLPSYTHHISEGYFNYADTSLSEIGIDPLSIFEALSYNGYAWADCGQTFNSIGDIFASIFGEHRLSDLSNAIERNFY